MNNNHCMPHKQELIKGGLVQGQGKNSAEGNGLYSRKYDTSVVALLSAVVTVEDKGHSL